MDELEDPNAGGKFVFDATVEVLKRSTDVESCVSLAGKINGRFEATFAHVKREGAPVACKAGCSFCCHIRVTVVPHEAIALFRYLKSEIPAAQADAIEQKVLANADQIKQMTQEQHSATNVQCAFLVDGKCSAYRARPMACAWHHSIDVNECEYSYKNPSDLSDGIPMLEVIQQIRAAAQDGFTQAAERLRLTQERMELHTAVAAILRDPSLIARWRSGRPLVKPAK